MGWRNLLGLGFIGLWASACSPDRASEGDGALRRDFGACGTCMTRLDTLGVLRAPDSLAFGEFSTVAVDGEGRYYATTGDQQVVLVFDSIHAMPRSLARPGAGPGELTKVRALVPRERGVVVAQAGRYSFFTGGGAYEAELRSRLACQVEISALALVCASTTPVGAIASGLAVITAAPQTPSEIRLPKDEQTCVGCQSYLAAVPGGGLVVGVGARTYDMFLLDPKSGEVEVARRIRTEWFYGPSGSSASGDSRTPGRIWGIAMTSSDTGFVVASAPTVSASSGPEVSEKGVQVSRDLEAVVRGQASVIEWFNVRSGVIQTESFEGRRLLPAGQSLLYEARYDDNVNVELLILRPTLTRR